jgi:hypothetical protein
MRKGILSHILHPEGINTPRLRANSDFKHTSRNGLSWIAHRQKLQTTPKPPFMVIRIFSMNFATSELFLKKYLKKGVYTFQLSNLQEMVWHLQDTSKSLLIICC